MIHLKYTVYACSKILHTGQPVKKELYLFLYKYHLIGQFACFSLLVYTNTRHVTTIRAEKQPTVSDICLTQTFPNV